jgi:hypothetical protein
MRTGIEVARHHAALARRARAVATAIGQDDARRQRGVEQRLTGFGSEVVLAGLNGDLEAHSGDA